MNYKLGQEGLQIGGNYRISNRDKKISNRGRDYKSRQVRLQTRKGVSNRGRDYKSVQNTIV